MDWCAFFTFIWNMFRWRFSKDVLTDEIIVDEIGNTEHFCANYTLNITMYAYWTYLTDLLCISAVQS